MELPVTFSVETGPQVGNENLRPFIQSDSPALKRGLVTKTGEALRQEVDKGCGRVVGVVDAVREAAVEILVHV